MILPSNRNIVVKRILGLDLGTASIGWAIVNEASEENEKSSIEKLGVRIVSLSEDEKKHFKSLAGETANQSRTLKRSMRRNLQRFKHRRELLIDILKKHGFITDDSVLYEKDNNSTFETYRLRAKAVTEEISLEELARVLLMINKKRGYKSLRKSNEAEGGKAIDGIEVAKELRDKNITPGEYSYEVLKRGKNKLPDFYRSDLEEEFEKIWNEQSKYHGELTEELHEELKGKTKGQTWSILSKKLQIFGEKCSLKGFELRLDNYRLRSKAVSQQVSLEEFVIIAQEINGEIATVSGYLSDIGEHSKSLVLNHQTIGQYLMSLLATDPNISLKNIVFYRNDYIAEFNAIWNKQAQFHTELTDALKAEIRDNIIFYQRPLKSKKGLLSVCELEQKEIQIEKNGRTVTKVIGNKVIPRSSFLFQEFKIWQTLNNIVVSLSGVSKKSKKGNDAPTLDFGEDELYINGSRLLTIEEKKLLAEELRVKPKLTKDQAIKVLFGNAKKLDLNFKVIDGNKTMSRFYEICSEIFESTGHIPLNFNERGCQIMEQAREEMEAMGWNTDILDFDADKPLDSQASYKLWHLLYSYIDDLSNSGVESLIEKISALTGINKEYCSKFANIAFVEDYGSLCAKAIKKILPYLKEGNQYDVACLYAGYKHSKNSLTKEEIENKVLKSRLDLLDKNSLRNPVVEKILNQMVNVVNALIDKYGQFDEIRVELARELKKNAAERKELTDSINKTTRENEDIKKKLQNEFGIQYPSRNDVIRYKLYKELEPNGYHTLYSDRYISQEDLFSREIDIEHIIPQARILDDSLSNKTLEFRDVNIEKGNRTAYDYVMGKHGAEGLQQYVNRCELYFKDKKTKLRKLLMSESEIPEDFVERDLRNTQYISKKALSMLSTISRRVVATSGTITSKLREDWQLIDVMKEINWDKYDALGLTEYHKNRDGKTIGQIKDWTKRNDHRHHAMDALTVAFTKDAFIQYFNNKNASDAIDANGIALRRTYVDGGKVLPPMPMDELRRETKRHIENILISIKAKNKVVTRNVNKIRTKNGIIEKEQLTPRGQLHNETIYGSHYEYVCKDECVGGTFDEAKILTVSKGAYRDALLKRYNEYGCNAKKAFTGKNTLEKNPIWLDENHKSAVPLTVKTVRLELRYTIRKAIDKDLKIDKVVDKQIKRLLQARLDEYGTAKAAFSNLDENPIWLNREKGVRLKRVTIYGIENGEAIHEKRLQSGKVMTEHMPVDYVSTSGNHHIAIYRKPKLDKKGQPLLDADGMVMTELEEVVVSFYEAVARAIQGFPIVDKEYRQSEGWTFLYSMKKNEYFVFPDEATGFNPQEINLLDAANQHVVSKHLYRVQKLRQKDYCFRHHLDTTVDTDKKLQDKTWIRKTSLPGMDKIVKVRINHLGEIVSVGEY